MQNPNLTFRCNDTDIPREKEEDKYRMSRHRYEILLFLTYISAVG